MSWKQLNAIRRTLGRPLLGELLLLRIYHMSTVRDLARAAVLIGVGALPPLAFSWPQDEPPPPPDGAEVAAPVDGGERDIADLSLEELLNVSVEVASNREKPLREQPGAVTVFTEDEIERSGAQNLADILKLVPGFWIGTDTQRALGASFRGMWGFEGKVLLIIDGIAMNELAFGTLVLGNHYSADQIKQVEIMRGPGSVSYGGAAELAVVKVTTKGSELNGTEAVVSAKISEHNLFNNNYVVMTGGESDDWKYSLSGFYGMGDFSNDDFGTLGGGSYRQKGNTDTEPINLNVGLAVENLSLRFIYDRFMYEERIGFGALGAFFPPEFAVLQDNYDHSFESFNGSIQYDWRVNDKLLIRPKLTLSWQHPWRIQLLDGRNHQRAHRRVQAEVSALWDITENANLLVGTTWYTDRGRFRESYQFDADTFYGGRDHVTYHDLAGYFQLEVDTDVANFTVGGRYEHHSYAGGQFVPRIGLTKAWEKWHAKLVYNQAFRTPQIDTIAAAGQAGITISGEESQALEGELGYQLSESLYLQGNLFWMEVDDFIVYNPTKFANDNSGTISTYGGEVMLRLQKDWGSLSTAYSYYRTDQNSVDVMSVAGHSEATLGIPNHKLTVLGTLDLTETQSINVSGTIIGPRYACVGDPDFVCGTPKRLNPEYDFTVFYTRKLDKMTYSIGVANLFDSDVDYIEPYMGGSAPIPGLGRSLFLRLAYRF